MKLNQDKYNVTSEDEEDEESGNEDMDAEDDGNDNGDSQDDDDDQDEELDDDEDEPPAVNPPANVAVASKQSLGGGNKKIVLKKPAEGGVMKSKSKTSALVEAAIKHLNERSGSSVVAIKRVIVSNNPDIDSKRLDLHIKRYIKTCLDNGTMVQIKRSFKYTKKHGLQSKQLEKEREKARKERLKEKQKEKKKLAKSTSKEKGEQKSKQNEATGKTKSGKRPPTKDTKDKAAKKTKLDKAPTASSKGGAKSAATKVSKASTEKTKSKMKPRKSINLVVRPTPPRPKSLKKAKPPAGAVGAKKKIDLKDDNAAGTSKSIVGAAGGSNKGKRK